MVVIGDRVQDCFSGNKNPQLSTAQCPFGHPGGVSFATLDFALDFVMAVMFRTCIEQDVLLPGLGIFFEAAVVVEVVLVVGLLRLFGMACAV